jgi:uncharacterized protein (DUF433 family)
MTLEETLIATPPPLRLDKHGVLRMKGSRIPLDTVVYEHLQGETPEQIAESYDTLALADIYAAIAYYLRYRQEVDAYLREREAEAEELRRKMTPILPSRDLRDRIPARLKSAS